MVDIFDPEINNDSITVELIKTILELTDEKRRSLLQQVQAMQSPLSEEEEGRDSTRKPYEGYIRFSKGEKVLWGSSRNISAGGMFIETEATFETGDLITVFLPLPKKKTTLKAPARVVRKTDTGIGVEFIKKIDA